MKKGCKTRLNGMLIASLALSLCGFLGGVRTQAEEKVRENVDKSAGITIMDNIQGVNLNGNSAIIMDTEGANGDYKDIYIDADKDGVLDVDEKASLTKVSSSMEIYGIYDAKTTEDILITYQSSYQRGTLYGAYLSDVAGVTINIKGSVGNVYGIYANTNATGDIVVNADKLNDGVDARIGNLYAAYGGCLVDGNVFSTISHVYISCMYGTSAATIKKDTTIEIKGDDTIIDSFYGTYGYNTDYTVGGNYKVTVRGAVVKSFYGLYSGGRVKGNAVIDIDGTKADSEATGDYWYYIYGVQNAVVEGTVDVKITNIEAYYNVYGVQNSMVNGAVDVNISKLSVHYGIYGIDNCSGSYKLGDDASVSISDIKVLSTNTFYGINSALVEGNAVVTMKNIKKENVNVGTNTINGVYSSTILKDATISLDDIDVAYNINGEYSCTIPYGTADITINNCQTYNSGSNNSKIPNTTIYGAYYGTIHSLQLKLTDCDLYSVYTTYYVTCLDNSDISLKNIKDSNCFDMDFNSGSDYAKTTKISFESCDLKNVSEFNLCAEDTVDIIFKDCNIQLQGTMVNSVYNKNEKTALTENFINTNITTYSSSQTRIGNNAYNCASSIMTFDSTSTVPEGIIIYPSSTSTCEGYAKIGNNYYLSGKGAFDRASLSETDNLYLSYFTGTIDSNFKVKNVSLNNCEIDIPEGKTFAGTIISMENSRFFVEGSLEADLKEGVNLSNAYSYIFVDGGSVTDNGWNGYKLYRVTPTYNKEHFGYTMTDSSSTYNTVFSFAQKDITKYFAKPGIKVKITCTVNTGYQLINGTYKGKSEAAASSLVRSSNTFSFDMPSEETSVTINSEGVPIVISKTKSDPIAKVNQTYAEDSPLYDFETLMLKNDSTETDKSIGVTVAAGTLPAGIKLEGTKLIGTPTVSNDEGTKITFRVTGKNGTSANIVLNIIVASKDGIKQPEQTDRVMIDDVAKTIDLNGNSVVLEASDSGTAFYYDDNRDGVADDDTPFTDGNYSSYYVYGVKDSRLNGKFKFTMNGGAIKYFYAVYNATVLSKAEDAVYVQVNAGTISSSYVSFNSSVAGGIIIHSKTSSLNAVYSGNCKGYILDNKGSVIIAGNVVLTEDIDATSITMTGGSYSNTVKVAIPNGKSMVANTYNMSYTEIRCKGSFGCNTSMYGNSYSKVYVFDEGTILDTTASLPYVYVPVSLTYDRSAVKDTVEISEPTLYSVLVDDLDTEEVEEITFGCVNGMTVYCTDVRGFSLKYVVNSMEPDINTSYYSTIKLDKKKSAIKVTYVPNQITATPEFADPIVYTKTTYDETDPVYDYSTVKIANDASISYGEVTYAIKEGSSLPEGLTLKDGKVIGKATTTTDKTVDTTVVITGRNGTKAEVTLTYDVKTTGEYVNINKVLSLNSSELNLNGYPVVIKSGDVYSSYLKIYLDLDQDGVADNAKAFTVDGATEHYITKLVGYKNTDVPYAGNISITMDGGSIQTVYGAEGTVDKQVTVNGNINVIVKGGSIGTILAGGYYASAKDINVKLTGGSFNNKIYGAYQPEKVDNVGFEMTGTAKYRNSNSGESYHVAIVDGGTVLQDVNAVMGSSGNIFYSSSSSYYKERFYGINNAKVKGNVNYEIVGTVQTGSYPNRFANNATIDGTMKVDWKTGTVDICSSSNKATFAYNSTVKSLNISVADEANASGTVYPYYKGTIEDVYMNVPSTCKGSVYTGLKHPEDISGMEAMPTKSGYVNNKGSMYVAGERTIAENTTISYLEVESGATLTINEDVVITGNGTIDNYGTIDNKGTYTQSYTVRNYGTLNNIGKFTALSSVTSSGTVVNTGTMATNYSEDISGTVENKGTWTISPTRLNTTYKLNVQASGKIINSGSIKLTNSYCYNYGTMENSGSYETNTYTYNYGTIDNKNSATFGGYLNLYQNSKLINSKELNTTSYVQALATGVTIENKEGGTWNATGYINLSYDKASIVNDGTWSTNLTVNVQNAGASITNNGYWNMNYGLYLNQATFTNKGTFTGKYNGTGTSYCVYDYMGKIYNEGTWEGNAYLYINYGYFENSGTMTIEPQAEGSTSYAMTISRNTSDSDNKYNGVFYNTSEAALNINARVNNGGHIVNGGMFRLNYANASYAPFFGQIYFAKDITFAEGMDVLSFKKKWSCYYPIKAEYLDSIVSGVTFVNGVSSPVESDKNTYFLAGGEFNVRVDGFVEESGYESDDIKTVKYGTDNTLATKSNVEDQFKGTMPYEATTVTFEFEKNATSKITIDPASAEIEELQVNTKIAKIYDLNNLTISGDEDVEGAKVNYAVSQKAPLPEGVTLTNGVIGGTPTKASAQPITTTIIVTGKNGTTAKFNLVFKKINKAKPSFSLPTGIYGYTDYTLSQCSNIPKPANGIFSWPDNTLNITDKCVAGEKFDIYFTPDDTDNYDWTSLDESLGTWNEEDKRLECKVSITMYTIPPSWVVGTYFNTTTTRVQYYYGDKFSDVEAPSDELGSCSWDYPDSKTGNAGTSSYTYATYTPKDTKRYSTKSVRIYYYVNKKPVELTAPKELVSLKGNTIGEVVLPTREDGTYEWKTATDTIVEDNVEYELIFRPGDTANYVYSSEEGVYNSSFGAYVFKVTIKLVDHREEDHVWETKHDKTYHWQECSCAEIRNKVEHDDYTYSKIDGDTVNHHATCSCGYEMDEKHEYVLTEGIDTHWKECKCGEFKDTASHNYNSTKYDETGHWKQCACGAKQEKILHSYSYKTYNGSQHWDYCSCGAKDTSSVEEHKYDILKNNASYHWYECSCGSKQSSVAHEYSAWENDTENNKHTRKCACGRTEEGTHNYDRCTPSGSEEEKHIYTCTQCGDTKEEAHSYDEGVISKPPTDTVDGEKLFTCTKCNGTKTEVIPCESSKHTHELNKMKSSATEHWVVCDDGDEYEFAGTRAAHQFETKTSATEHWKECSICHYKKDVVSHTFERAYNDQEHYYECSCGYKKGSEKHNLSVTSDEVNHWQACSCGYRQAAQKHSYVTRKYDKNSHWMECSCGRKKNIINHDFTKWEEDVENNKHIGTCDCGYKLSENHNFDSFEKINDTNHKTICDKCFAEKEEAHDYDEGKVTKNPTVTETGTKTYTCRDCGQIKYEEVATVDCEHNTYSEAYTYDENQHWRVCTDCDMATTDLSDHDFGEAEVIKKATEEEEGSEKYTCEICGYVKTVTVKKLAHVHKYDNLDYDENAHWYYCSCSDKEIAKKANHSFDAAVVLTPATTTTKGLVEYICKVCGETKQEETPMLEAGHTHIYSGWANDKKNNKHIKQCACGDTIVGEHKYSDNRTRIDATNHARICEDCGARLLEAHRWGEGISTETPGRTLYTCIDCEAQKYETIEVVGHVHQYGDWIMDDEYVHKKSCTTDDCVIEIYEKHKYNNGEITKQPTYKEDGVKTYTCSTCGGTKTETLAKKVCASHDYKLVNTKDATYDETGYNEYSCSLCGNTYKDVIPKKQKEETPGGNDPVVEDPDVDDPDDNEDIPESIGTILPADASSKAIYKVINDDEDNPEVEYLETTNKKATSISIPETITVNGIKYKVTSIKEKAFKNNKTIKSVKISKTVVTIGASVFENCKKLSTVTFAANSNLETIGGKAFASCPALKKLTITSTKLTKKSVGAKVFTKAGSSNYKKLTIKVPKKSLKDYKSFFYKKGLNKKSKIK